MAINWYPGHMVKAKREIQENMKLVDIVAMLLDARAPFSCRNSDLEKISQQQKIAVCFKQNGSGFTGGNPACTSLACAQKG